VGLTIDNDPAHVWHQEVVAPGYDGMVNDYFLVRATSFDPRGALSAGELTAARSCRSAGPASTPC
jgi:8-oxo-dGTP diphosphatase